MTIQLWAFAIIVLMSCVVFADESDERKKVDYPESDIFLFDVLKDGDQVTVGNGRNVTNRPGYENQPFFTNDSRSFLFSQSDAYQTDVFEYFIDTGETKQVTKTDTMEFSPQPSPNNDTISFVTDGEGANQSVWHINRDDKTPVWTLKDQPEREPVGYYSWNHDTGYILFWSRYGFNVRFVHETKKLSHYISGNAVPTSPHMIPGTKFFSFLHRQGNGQVWIKELNPETLAVRPVTPVIGNNTHYGWAPDGSIVMMEGTVLHRWAPDAEGWQKVADLGVQGLASATRVAVSPDGKKLAVVGVPVTPADDSKASSDE